MKAVRGLLAVWLVGGCAVAGPDVEDAGKEASAAVAVAEAAVDPAEALALGDVLPGEREGPAARMEESEREGPAPRMEESEREEPAPRMEEKRGGPAPRMAEEEGAAPAPRAAGVAPAREVRVPRDAAWLGDPVTVHYSGIRASMVMRQLAGRRPIRLAFDVLESGDPLVAAPPAAVTIQDHLEAVCGQADWTYSVSGGTVLVHDMETRVFPLSVPPGRTSSRMVLRGLGAGAGGDAGGEGPGNDVVVESEPYAEEIGGFVEALLGMDGDEDAESAAVDPRTRVWVLPSANAVAVTARPHRMRLVERELAAYNETAARVVRLRIVVYEVDVSDTDERALDLQALRSAGTALGLRISPVSDAGSGGAVRLDFVAHDRFDGSRVVLEWLRTAGRTSIEFQDQVEIRNNQMASVDATETRQYLERFSRQTQSAGATSFETPTVEFGQLRLGWSINLQPTIEGDSVTVRVGLSRSSLVEERPYSFDGGSVQGTMHVTDDYNRRTSVTLASGETRLVTMLADENERTSARRVPWLPWLGDGRSRKSRDRETVMMLTAEVL